MDSIYEKRRYKRLPITLNLEVKQIYKQDYEVINGIDTSIQVFNISKNGIGFICKTKLPTGYYFNSKIQLGEDDFFYSVIQIIRCSVRNEEEYLLGAEFVGLAPFLANKIEEYEKRLENKI